MLKKKDYAGRHSRALLAPNPKREKQLVCPEEDKTGDTLSSFGAGKRRTTHDKKDLRRLPSSLDGDTFLSLTT